MNDIVNDRLKQLDWSAYRLTKEVAGKVPASSVYDFLRGTSTINSAFLSAIFEACGLTVVAKPEAKKRKA